MLNPGLYEQVINKQLDSELSAIPEACQSTAPIDKAEASKVLAQYLSEVVQQGLDNVVDNGGDISAQIAGLANTSGKKFFDPVNAEIFPQKDFEMSTQLDKHPFALKVNRENGVFVEKVDI